MKTEEVLEKALKRSGIGVVVIQVQPGGNVDVDWSDLPIEVVCYARQVLDLAIHNQLEQMMMEKTAAT